MAASQVEDGVGGVPTTPASMSDLLCLVRRVYPAAPLTCTSVFGVLAKMRHIASCAASPSSGSASSGAMSGRQSNVPASPAYGCRGGGVEAEGGLGNGWGVDTVTATRCAGVDVYLLDCMKMRSCILP